MEHRDLCMRTTVYLPMKDNETKGQAEDRLLELVESVGVYICGWREDEVEIEEWEDEDESGSIHVDG